MSNESLAWHASESLSRVTCSFCGGRLYTDHKPDCPTIAARERDRAELMRLIRAASVDAETKP